MTEYCIIKPDGMMLWISTVEPGGGGWSAMIASRSAGLARLMAMLGKTEMVGSEP